MLTCHNIADYFLFLADNEEDGADLISNLKLQKLVYYAQGFHLAIKDEPFFGESIEAWQHGPVTPELYHNKKQYGSCAIPVNVDFDPEVFSGEQVELLNEIYDVYGQFSAWKLRNMTHEEAPWKNHESDQSEIPHDEMASYFKTQLQ